MTFAKTIVVGTDGSETAGSAVAQAARLAATDAARLVVVTAFTADGPGGVVDHGERAPDEITWQVGHRGAAERIANDARSAAHEAGVRDVVIQAVGGAPAETLLEVAERFGADVIVVGSIGLTSPSRFVLGSVAGTVAHHAPCDVLIVHTN